MTGDPLLEVTNLAVRFAGADHATVSNVGLTIRPGECVALVGESGSGKSTIARALLGLAPEGAQVTASTFTVDSADARQWKERDWRAVRGRFAGLILQDALVSLDPLRSVGREVEEAVRESGVPRGQRHEEVIDLLRSVGFPNPEKRSTQYAHELSGGLRQRALIASALGGNPQLLIADEPTTALDVTVQRQVLDLLRHEREQGLGILLVSHDLAVVADIADFVLVLHHGRIVERGAPRELLTRPAQPYTRNLVNAIPRAAADANPSSSPRRCNDPILRAEHISVEYRSPAGGTHERFTALDDVSVEVQPGQTLGIVGESGSGKSTLLRILLATQEPDSGTVTLDGRAWSGIPERSRRDRRRRMQMVPQDPLSSFDPRYSVRRILSEAFPRGKGDSAAVSALDAVALSADLLDRYPLELSGGQRQRVAIARAIATDPQILLCDEAVSALDMLAQKQILALLRDIQDERGISIVFVSHDLRVVRSIAQEVVVLKEGHVVEFGPARKVYEEPQHPYTRLLLEALPKASTDVLR